MCATACLKGEKLMMMHPLPFIDRSARKPGQWWRIPVVEDFLWWRIPNRVNKQPNRTEPVRVTVKRSLTVDSALGVTSVAFSHDGSIIAAAYLKKIQLFDAQTQAKLGSPLSGHSR
jgi:WD40 repeat protein